MRNEALGETRSPLVALTPNNACRARKGRCRIIITWTWRPLSVGRPICLTTRSEPRKGFSCRSRKTFRVWSLLLLEYEKLPLPLTATVGGGGPLGIGNLGSKTPRGYLPVPPLLSPPVSLRDRRNLYCRRSKFQQRVSMFLQPADARWEINGDR